MVLKRRHCVKSLTWRICATIVTVIVTACVTGSIEIGMIIGPIDFVIKIVLYYIHERAWMTSKFGITASQPNVKV